MFMLIQRDTSSHQQIFITYKICTLSPEWHSVRNRVAEEISSIVRSSNAKWISNRNKTMETMQFDSIARRKQRENICIVDICRIVETFYENSNENQFSVKTPWFMNYERGLLFIVCSSYGNELFETFMRKVLSICFNFARFGFVRLFCSLLFFGWIFPNVNYACGVG